MLARAGRRERRPPPLLPFTPKVVRPKGIIQQHRRFDSNLLRLIDVFHADLPSIGVTIADPCFVTLP